MTIEEFDTLKPGDLVIGNKSNPYPITHYGQICEVIEKNDNFTMTVSAVNGNYKGKNFCVDIQFFDVYNDSPVEQISELELSELMKEIS